MYNLKQLIFHTVILVLFLSGCDLKSSDQYFNDAYQKSNKGDYVGAIEDLSKVIKRNPKDYEAYTNRGADYAAIGKYEEAISDYDMAIELNNKNIMAYFNRGNSKSKISNFNGAIEDYNHAINLKGGEKLFLELQDNEFIGFRSVDVKIEEIRLQRGIAYGELNNYEKAFPDFDFCVNRKFDVDIALLWRGVCYYNLGYIKNACMDWEISKHQEAKKYFVKNCNVE